MRDALLVWLRCALCASRLRVEWSDGPGPDYREAVLTDSAGHRFPVIDGIPRLFPSASTEHATWLKARAPDSGNQVAAATGQARESVASFGFQWNLTAQPRAAHDIEYRVLRKSVLPAEFFPGRLVLDAGCGAGLQAGYMADLGATVVALDLSDAVLAAARNNANRAGVHVIQGDLTRPPLAHNAFDLVYSEGVLHHTSDPAATFQSIVGLVRPGGQIAAGFYGRRERGLTPFLLLRTPLRAILSRLPRRVVWWLTALSVPLNVIPGVNQVLRKTVLLYDPRDPRARATWCLNYDFYGPHQFQHYLRPSEINAIWTNPSLGLDEFVEGEGGFRRATRVGV